MAYYAKNGQIIEVGDPSINKDLIAGATALQSTNLTAAQNEFKSMVPPAPAPTLIDRYSTQRADLSRAYPDTPAPDENAIRDASRQRAQALINGINTKFASIERADAAVTDQMNRERRGSNVLSGLTGSKTGGARTVGTLQEGEKIKANTAAQKNAEIAAVLTDAETRGTEEFLTQRRDYIANAKDKIQAEQQLSDRVKNFAFNEIKTLAAGSDTYDELKAKKPNLISQYMQETGMSEEALKAFFIANKPEAEKVHSAVYGDELVVVTRDPVTGLTKTERIKVPVKANTGIKDTVSRKDGIYVIYNDGTYKKIGEPDPTTTNGIDSQDPTKPTFEEYLAEKQKAAQMSFAPAKVEETRAEYNTKYGAAAPVLGKLTPTNVNDLKQAGLGTAPTEVQSYFLNTPAKFRDQFQRDLASGTVKGSSLDDISKAYEEWYNSEQQEQARDWEALLGG